MVFRYYLERQFEKLGDGGECGHAGVSSGVGEAAVSLCGAFVTKKCFRGADCDAECSQLTGGSAVGVDEGVSDVACQNPLLVASPGEERRGRRR